MTEDEWYDKLDREYSKTGYTFEQFKTLTLQSALENDDGLCWPPSIQNQFDWFSVLTRLLIDGLIVRKHFRHDQPLGPFLITDKGREYIKVPRHD